MHQCGSIDYTREILRQLYAQITEEIGVLGGHERLLGLLEHLDAEIDRCDAAVVVGTREDDGEAAVGQYRI